MNTKQPISTFLGIAAGLVLAVNGHAATINVPGDFATIQEAIAASMAGDEIIVAPGTYDGPITVNGVTLRSTGGADVTSICGGGPVVTFGGALLDGFTISGGAAAEAGGMLISGGTVTNCVFTSNVATSNQSGGGAMFVQGSPTIMNCLFVQNNATNDGAAILVDTPGGLTVIDCTFDGNAAQEGGAIYCRPSTSLNVSGSLFCDNAANSGGAILSTQSGLTLVDCLFQNNSGGAMSVRFGAVSLTDCWFIQNSVSQGGGLDLQATHGLVTNCKFCGNSGSFAGGGVRVAGNGGSPNFESCVFANNSAGPGQGGGIFVAWNSPPPTVTNSAFCHNDPDHIQGAWVDGGGNNFVSECSELCFADLNGDGTVNVLDLIDLLLCFGQPVPPCGPADVNHDGAVDVLDLIDLLVAFGTPCP